MEIQSQTMIARSESPAPTVIVRRALKPGTISLHHPSNVILLGENYAVSTWRSVLITICTVLAERHGTEFAAKAITLKGRKRQYIAEDPKGMISAAQMPGTSLWVETNQSAESVKRQARQLLELFGYSESDVTISVVES